VLGFVANARLPDDILNALHHPREIDPRLQRIEAEPAGGPHLVGQPGRGDQALRRHAAREQAIAARLLCLLDQRHPRAEARRIERGDQPSGAAAQDSKVVPCAHRSLGACQAANDSARPRTVWPPSRSKRNMPRLRFIGVLVLAALAVAACEDELAKQDDARRGGGPTDALRVDASGWETDFTKHSVPLSEFLSGGPPRDGIPPVDEPKPTSQAEADEWLADREPVLAVEVGDRVRAYPLQILVWHEIVNDTLGGRPIAVTYCPLCNSSLVFDRRVRGRTLTFGTTGNLRNSDLVMWDRQTESWWQQLTAEAVVGELTGTRLAVLPSQVLSWADFKRLHPDGDVLSRDTGVARDYGRNPYEGYDQPDSQPFLFDGKTDDRLPPKERVIAVFTRRETVVVPFSRLAREPVVDLEAGGLPVVVFYKRGVTSHSTRRASRTPATSARPSPSTGAWAAGRSATNGAATASSTPRRARTGTWPAGP
jgi:hypothetical protein